MNQFRETLSSSEPGSEPSGSLDPGLQSLANLAGQMGNTPKLASSEVSSTKDEKNEVARNNRIVGEKALQSYNDDLLRRQLVVERALNSSFTPMADLIAMMESGKEESSAQTVTYNGHDITIFNTGNLQFRYLQHSIEYSGGDGHPLVDRPELWDATKDEAKANQPNASNMLSMHYHDSIDDQDQSKGHHGHDTIRYGFMGLPYGTLCTMSEAGQFVNKKRDSIDLGRWVEMDPIKIQQELIRRSTEVQAFRYDENGSPNFHPDFIIAPSSGVNETVLKQADYFHVPVFEIPTHHIDTAEEEKAKRIWPIKHAIEKYVDEHDALTPGSRSKLLALAQKPTESWSRVERFQRRPLYNLLKELEQAEKEE